MKKMEHLPHQSCPLCAGRWQHGVPGHRRDADGSLPADEGGMACGQAAAAAGLHLPRQGPTMPNPGQLLSSIRHDQVSMQRPAMHPAGHSLWAMAEQVM